MSDFSFNLIDEPWIPGVNIDGDNVTLGIRDLLMKAHQLRSIQHQNPLTEAALLRVLLAVVHRAVDGPRNTKQWKELYQGGKFDNRVADYLVKWHNRFDLFSSEAPFYQTPGLLVIDGSGNAMPQSISSIILGVSNGHNKTLFDHTTDDMLVRTSPAEAALALITAQMFSLGGLNKKTTNLFGYQFRVENSVMTEGIFLVLSGSSLFETLMLNLLIYNDNEPIPNTLMDCPVWERTDMGRAVTDRKKAIPPKGYLDFLTCKCRHIALVPQVDGNRIFVEHIHFAQGELFADVMNPGFMSRKSKKGNWYHPQLDIDRLVWRDSAALFSLDESIAYRPKAFRQVQTMRSVVDLPSRYICCAYAIANKDANPLVWRRETFNVPLSLLSDKNIVAYLEKAISLTEKGEAILSMSVKIFMREYLPKNFKDVAEKAKATGTVRTYWDNMERHFHQFLLDMDDPETALVTWETAIKRTAHDALVVCVNGRYRGSARAYRAWSAASDYINVHLAKLY